MQVRAPAPSVPTFRTSVACDLDEVRPAVRRVCYFLEQQGLHPEERMNCELALVEACNNAIQHTPPDRRHLRIQLTAICNSSRIELRVSDNTPGFQWSENAPLPEVDRESGRGIFIIQALMDKTSYIPGDDQNTLVMKRNRIYQGHRNGIGQVQNLEEAQRRILEAERVIGDMAKELCFRTESLAAIFRCSAQAAQAGNLEQFARNLLTDLLHISSAEWYMLRIVTRDGRGMEVFAAEDEALNLAPLIFDAEEAKGDLEPLEIRSLLERRDFLFPEEASTQDPLLVAKPGHGGIIHPFYMGDTPLGTLTVGKSGPTPSWNAAQIEVIHTLAEFFAIQLVNDRLQEDRVGMRLVAHELEIARNIQKALLPKTMPVLRGFEVAGFCESARQVGGDFYDVIELSDSSLLFMVADVMGKGVPAAMFASVLHRLLRAMPEWTTQPSQMLSKLNSLMFEELSEVGMFITAQIAVLDAKQRTLTTANAGHCPLLVVSGPSPTTLSLSPEGMPLGIMRATEFLDQTIELGPQGRMLLYTDGVPDAQNSEGATYGQERLALWLQKHANKPWTAEEFASELRGELRRFQGNTPLRDDQTFLAVVEQRKERL